MMNQSVIRSALLRERFDLHVIPLRFAESIADIGAVNLSKIWRTLVVAMRLVFRLAVARPDGVYFTLSPVGVAFLRDCLFVGLMKLFMVRRIYHMHGKGIRAAAARSRLRRGLYRWAFKGADVIHLSGRHLEDVGRFIEPNRFHVVPNGIPAPEQRAPSRRAKMGEPVHLLFLSNLIRTKGPLVFLDALGQLKSGSVPFRATFAGAWTDDRLKKEILERLSAYELQDSVDFAGFVSGTAKDEVLEDADILAYPTLLDTFPLVVLEAMACALPVVCSDEGSLPDIVHDGETGILVPKGNATALADALKSLIGDPPTCRHMGQAGRRRYETEFTLQQFEKNMAAVLEHCINAGPKRRES